MAVSTRWRSLSKALLSLSKGGKLPAIGANEQKSGHRAAPREIRMKNFAIPALVVTAALASCSSTERERPLPVTPAPVTIEGTWTDPNGLISTFQAGAFSTRTTDTNQMLATGSYANTSGNLYEISLTSLVQNKQSKVNCALVNPNQLNCTADSGAQFTLARQSNTVAAVTSAPAQ
jgi:hypothetical protein